MLAVGLPWVRRKIVYVDWDEEFAGVKSVVLLAGKDVNSQESTLGTLAPDDIQRACCYRDRQGKKRKPDWRDAPNGRQYFPSYNIAPGAHTPVLFSRGHLAASEAGSSCGAERVIQPMLWGLVPSWHKGSMADKAYETNNCRAESMLDKMTYKVPLQKGRRCVILAEGFFEWKRDKSSKQPYYIYFPQTRDTNSNDSKVKLEGHPGVKQEQSPDTNHNGIDTKVKVEGHPEMKYEQASGTNCEHTGTKVKVEVKQDANDTADLLESKQDGLKVGPGLDLEAKMEQTSKEEAGRDEDGAGLPRLLTMAGVFDVWQPQGGDPVYSYSVITVESSPAMAWIHHRMPAMLTTEEEIDQWLSFGEVPLNKAVKVIRPVLSLDSHPVSTVVNNSRNKTPDCVKQIDLSAPKKLSASGSMMMSWLSKANKKEPDSSAQPPHKRHKTA